MDHGTIHQASQHLLRERVSIRDIVCICEALAGNVSSLSGDPLVLAEAARKRLARRINGHLADAERRIVGLTLEPDTERHVAEELQLLEDEPGLPAREALAPARRSSRCCSDALAAVRGAAVPVLVVSPAVAAPGGLLSRYTGRLRVLATDELHPAFRFIDKGLA